MAGRTGDLACARQAGVVEEAAPEFDLFGRDRIVGGRWNGVRARERRAPERWVKGFSGAGAERAGEKNGAKERRTQPLELIA